jgi:hypothetical protein
MSNPIRKIRFTHTDGDGFILAYTRDENQTVNLTREEALQALSQLANVISYEYELSLEAVRATIPYGHTSPATSEASPSLPPKATSESPRTNMEQFYDLARAYMRGVCTADECLTRARELGFTDQQWHSHMITCNPHGRPPQA